MKPENSAPIILYVIGSLSIGGTERHLLQIAPRLQHLGWKPIVYCLSRVGTLAPALQQQGVEVLGPPLQSLHNPIGKALRLLLSAFKLFALMLRRRPTVVHFYLPSAYLIGAPLSMLARSRIRIMSRRSLNLYQNKYPGLRRVESFLHSHMSALLANSLAVKQELLQEKAPPERIHVTYNGIEVPNAVARSTETPGKKRDASLVLIIVANLIPYKGHADLFHALAAIKNELPQGWLLLCVGRDDGYGETLKKLAQELHVGRNIEFTGEVRDSSIAISSADIAILCSHEEGFSNAILEAMAAGLPMVVTDVGGNAEAVLNNKTGLVVPAKNPLLLGQAILQLARDPVMRRDMGQAAYLRVKTVFSLEKCLESYDKLYQTLTAAVPGGKSPLYPPGPRRR